MSVSNVLDVLWVKGFSGISDADTREYCSQFGRLVHMQRPPGKDYLFLTYFSEKEAAIALRGLREKGIAASYKKKNVSPIDSDTNTNSPSQPDQLTTSNSTNSVSSSRNVHFSNTVSTGNSSGERPRNQTFNQPIEPKRIIFRSGDEVIITHFRDGQTFFAYPVSEEQDYKRLLAEISMLGKSKGRIINLSSFDINGKMLIVPHNGDYYRGLIVDGELRNGMVMVRLCDIGSTVSVPANELQTIPKTYTDVRINYRFKLNGVDDTTCNSYAAKCLQTFKGKTFILKFIGDQIEQQTEQNLTIELIEPQTGQNVNQLIRDLERTFNLKDLIHYPAPIGKNQKLITIEVDNVQDGFNRITFIDEGYLSDFHKQRVKIQKTCDILLGKCPPHVPNKAGSLCVAKYKYKWHRGIFAEQVENTNLVKVLLIDIGRGVVVDRKDIRNITEELVRMPVLSFAAAVDGFPEKLNKIESDEIAHKFKAKESISVTSISESSYRGIYTIEIY